MYGETAFSISIVGVTFFGLFPNKDNSPILEPKPAPKITPAVPIPEPIAEDWSPVDFNVPL